MTSGETFPHRLTQIDALMLPDHVYFAEEDTCYFLGEYTARQGYGYSATNHLVWNFKKSMGRRNRPEWRYKGIAIRQAPAAFRNALNPAFVDYVTFVPVPPSKAKGDSEYDDRITQILRYIRHEPPIDVRELVVQSVSTGAAHESDNRPSPADLVVLYELDGALAMPEPQTLVVVDDVLTTGSHYRAVQRVLSGRFPSAQVVGLFIARRAPDASDFWDLSSF